jgi:hypothetical protein
MSLGKLFASIRERRRRSAQRSREEGALIRRRLQDLLAVPTPTQVEAPSSYACNENEPAWHSRKACLNLGISEASIGQTKADLKQDETLWV